MNHIYLFIFAPLLFISCEKNSTDAPVPVINEGPCMGITSVSWQEKTYETLEIGDQCWFRENINSGIIIDHNTLPADNKTLEKYCLCDLEENCEKYGAFYTWDEAMAYNADNHTGICPDGWHIASLAEWQELEQYISTAGILTDSCCSVPKAIAINKDWKESECMGAPGCHQCCNGIINMQILASGYLNIRDGSFYGETIGSYFWTSAPPSCLEYTIVHLSHDHNEIYYGNPRQNYALSIRCIKD